MNGKLTLILCVLLLAACADRQAAEGTPAEESTSAPAILRASDLDAIFDGLDLSDATLTDYGEKETLYPADGAIRAKSYVEKLQGYSWAECQSYDGSVENELYHCRLTASGVTMTAFRDLFDNSYLFRVVTDSGEGWFTLENGQAGWMIYDTFANWYQEARAAALYGGAGIPLTAEELDWFRDYTASTQVYYDETRGDQGGAATAISCFFTSQYSDPRDMDAGEFLSYCPAQGNLGPEDEAEFQLVQTKLNRRGGEDQHLITISELPIPCHRLPRTYINEILTQYAGITLEDMHTDWRESTYYILQTDCFYTFTSDFGPGSFLPVYGEKADGIVTLWEAPGENGADEDELTLQSVDGGYQILSHETASLRGNSASK